jgi:hypothetical protein
MNVSWSRAPSAPEGRDSDCELATPSVPQKRALADLFFLCE